MKIELVLVDIVRLLVMELVLILVDIGLLGIERELALVVGGLLVMELVLFGLGLLEIELVLNDEGLLGVELALVLSVCECLVEGLGLLMLMNATKGGWVSKVNPTPKYLKLSSSATKQINE